MSDFVKGLIALPTIVLALAVAWLIFYGIASAIGHMLSKKAINSEPWQWEPNLNGQRRVSLGTIIAVSRGRVVRVRFLRWNLFVVPIYGQPAENITNKVRGDVYNALTRWELKYAEEDKTDD